MDQTEYKRTWGVGKLPTFVEVPNQRGNDCALVANQVALTLYEGGSLTHMDMDSSNLRITQAGVVWDMIRTRLVQFEA